jgi:hypothetical protein
MPDSTTHPMDLHAALTVLHDQLPELMGGTLPDSFRGAAERLGTSPDRQQQESAAKELRQELTNHPEARDAVGAYVTALSQLRQSILPTIRQSLQDEKAADQYATSILHGVIGPDPDAGAVRTRGVKIPTGGIGGAKTVKLRNLLVRSDKVADFVGESALFTLHSSTDPNPFLIGFALVLLARCAFEAVTVHISEHDATVFWGLIQAQKQPDNADSAPEPDVVKLTNAERTKANRGPLAPTDVARALGSLAEIKCVEKVVGDPPRWRIIEKFKIKG